MNKKTLHIIKQIFFYVFIVLFVGIIVLPFLWQFLTSIKPMSEISAMPAKWIPSEINIQYYFNVFEKHPFGKYLFNSLVAYGNFKHFYVSNNCHIESDLPVVKRI